MPPSGLAHADVSDVLSGREQFDKSSRESDEGARAEGAKHGPSGAEEQESRQDGDRE